MKHTEPCPLVTLNTDGGETVIYTGHGAALCTCAVAVHRYGDHSASKCPPSTCCAICNPPGCEMCSGEEQTSSTRFERDPAPVIPPHLQPQQAPKSGTGRPTWELVLEDFGARDQHGLRKYKEPHRFDNGRNHLWDAYQEALDLVVYLRAEIEQQEEAGYLRCLLEEALLHASYQAPSTDPTRAEMARIWAKAARACLGSSKKEG